MGVFLTCAALPADGYFRSFLLANHTVEHFPFLDISANRASRSTYYHALTRLLFASDENAEVEFLEFIKPFSIRLDELLRLPNLSSFQDQRVQVRECHLPSLLWFVNPLRVLGCPGWHFSRFAVSLDPHAVPRTGSYISSEEFVPRAPARSTMASSLTGFTPTWPSFSTVWRRTLRNRWPSKY